jgi:hypothetical protein
VHGFKIYVDTNNMTVVYSGKLSILSYQVILVNTTAPAIFTVDIVRILINIKLSSG